jgi:hypothetical protein
MKPIKHFNEFKNTEISESGMYNAQFFKDAERAHKRMESEKKSRTMHGKIMDAIEKNIRISNNDYIKIANEIQTIINTHNK